MIAHSTNHRLFILMLAGHDIGKRDQIVYEWIARFVRTNAHGEAARAVADDITQEVMTEGLKWGKQVTSLTRRQVRLGQRFGHTYDVKKQVIRWPSPKYLVVEADRIEEYMVVKEGQPVATKLPSVARFVRQRFSKWRRKRGSESVTMLADDDGKVDSMFDEVDGLLTDALVDVLSESEYDKLRRQEQGMQLREIADFYEIPVGTLKAQLSRAKQKAKKMLFAYELAAEGKLSPLDLRLYAMKLGGETLETIHAELIHWARDHSSPAPTMAYLRGRWHALEQRISLAVECGWSALALPPSPTHVGGTLGAQPSMSMRPISG